MRPTRALASSLAILALLAAACSEEPRREDPEEEEFPPITTPGWECPQGNVVSWENFAESWITRQCVPCHSVELGEGQRAYAPLGVDFNTYEMVRQWADRIYARSAGNNETMPPAGGPYPEDRILMADWLACQAPREEDFE